VVIDREISDSRVRIDQTLRTAVGIPFEYDKDNTSIQICPLHLSLSQRMSNFLSRLLGRRYLFLLVCKAHVPDLEKDVCRIPLDAFHLLGTTVGNRVVFENVIPVDGRQSFTLKTFSQKTYELYTELIQERESLEEPDFSARYPSAEALLKISPDIWRVFFDAHSREKLDVSSCDAVKARRHLLDLFLKEIREFGIIFFLSLFTIIQVLPVSITWLVLIPTVTGSTLVALFLVLANIRAKVK